MNIDGVAMEISSFFYKVDWLLQYLLPIMTIVAFLFIFYHLVSSLKALQLIAHHDLLLRKEISSAIHKEDCLYTISSPA